ncbi:MAG: D-alanine--D-alanine ligase [Clostridiales bacterium]|nr:D-alanine--D-alanine ligase [Clostridiales bacterium]
MHKIKIGIICGGKSTEHEVSVISANSVIKNLNKDKYEIYNIFIDKGNDWYEKNNDEEKKIEDINNFLKNLDVVFPVLHGLYGEDGTIQGMLELLGIPYVGCKVLASSIAMDKVYTKIIFDRAGIKQAKYVYIKKEKNNYIYIDENFNEEKLELEEICKRVERKIKYPMFVKPSNSGSSVGINKSKNNEELKKHIEYAAQFDNKILIEENIIGREIECAIIGNEDVNASVLGEIKSAEEFYSFDAKYKNNESKTIIPATLSEDLTEKVRKLAVKAFKAIDGKGFSRVDFFVNGESNDIYINEINTIPGFTEISMYPKLWEASGLKYTELLDELINLAME